MSSIPVKRNHSDDGHDSEVAASFKRLCNAKRNGHEGTQKIKEMSEAIWKLEKEREEAVQEEARFLKGPLTDSCQAYSQAWNRSFASKLLTIPRELRDMVYAQIWTKDFLSKTSPAMVGRLQGVEVAPLPHVVNTMYVGPDVAREVVEAYYRLAPRHVHAFDAADPDDIERLVCEDIFEVGINPANILRQMNITLDVDSLNLPFNEEVDVQQINEPLTSLLKIVKKKDFKLKIELSQRRVRLNLWEAYFKMLKPILEVFKNEGAKVDISWTYRYEDPWHPSPVRRRLNDFIRERAPGWKEDMIRSLLGESAIDPYHMEFLHEDNDDYDPTMFEDEDEDDFSVRRGCTCASCGGGLHSEPDTEDEDEDDDLFDDDDDDDDDDDEDEFDLLDFM